MDEQATRKLPKAERREQLLATARRIIGEEGTEALTLAHVAASAGVSKPIAYEHFGTRAGLLIALCDDYNNKQVAAQAQLLETGATLADIARIFAGSYVNCVMDIGPEMGQAFDALAASDETAAFRQSLRQGHIDAYRKGFDAFIDLPGDDAVLAGLFGATEALAKDAAAGRIGREAATEALTRIFISTLEQYPRKK